MKSTSKQIAEARKLLRHDRKLIGNVILRRVTSTATDVLAQEWLGAIDILTATKPQEPHEPPAELVEAVRYGLGAEPWPGYVIGPTEVAWVLGARAWIGDEETSYNELIIEASNDDLRAAIETVLSERGDDDVTE